VAVSERKDAERRAEHEKDERLEDLEPEREDAEAVKGGGAPKDFDLQGVEAQHNETLVRA